VKLWYRDKLQIYKVSGRDSWMYCRLERNRILLRKSHEPKHTKNHYLYK